MDSSRANEPQLPPWVQRINAKKKGAAGVPYLFFILMKELHLSYEDLRKMPIPAIFALADELKKFQEEQEKELKRQRRR